MKPLSFVFSLFFIVTLVACNGVGNKDTLIARIGNENVYQEDLDLLYNPKWGSDTAPEYKQAIEDFFTQTAQVSQFLQENPEYETRWKQFKSVIEAQVLALTYTRYYLSENLGYSDEELEKYMEKHPEQYGNTPSLLLTRSHVARQLYLEENADTLERYIAQALKEKNQSGEVATEEENREMLTNFFVLLHRESLFEDLKKTLSSENEYVVEAPKPENPEKFFNEHRDSFKTVPGYELYHVAMADSVKLSTLFAGQEGMNLDSFKVFAAEKSEDSLTASTGGYIGRVKHNYAIPFGIGMMPNLFEELQGKSEGYVSSVTYSKSDKRYHIFYLSKLIPSEQKSFERAKASINQVFGEDVANIDSLAVVVSKAGSPVYREKDVRSLFAEAASGDYDKESRMKLVTMLKDAAIVSSLAKRVNLDHSWEYRAFMRQQRVRFLYQNYRKTLAKQEIGSAEYKQIPVPEYVLKYGYAMKKEVLCGEKSFEDCRGILEDEMRKAIFSSQVFKLQAQVWNKVKASFYDTKWEKICTQKGLAYYLDKARELAHSRNIQKSMDVINNLVAAFAEDEASLQKIILEAAQIQSDASLFNNAEMNYEAFYTIWPEHPEAEKAMFSRGFVLNENLHKDKEALRVLEAFCKKYPKSELKESAEWLMADIKSSGKLADDLMKKIDAEGN